MKRRRTLIRRSILGGGCTGPLDDPRFWTVLFSLLFVVHAAGHDDLINTGCCRSEAKSLASKTYASPYVFEGSVGGGGGGLSSTSTHHHRRRVTFTVDRLYKGDPTRVSAAQNQVSLQFRSDDDDANDVVHPSCVFRPDIFDSRRRFIVFATAAADKNDDDDANFARRTSTADVVSDVDDDDVWWSDRAIEMPTFYVFCEPIALNKKSSRRIQKILRRAKPPTVSGLKNVTVRLNRRLKLVCRAKGRPAPTITWYKDGRPLVENANVIVRFNRSVSQLIIRNAHEVDAGQYECRATIESTGLSSVVNATVTVKMRSRRPLIGPTSKATQRPKSDRKGFSDDTFTGKECPVEHFCQNNSTCVFIENLGEAYCRCVDGFVGGRCEHKNVFFVLGEVKQTDQKNLLTVAIILGVLLCITILSNVTYFIFRAKRKIQKEKKEVPTKDCGGGSRGFLFRGRLSVDGDVGEANAEAIEMQQVVANRSKVVRRQRDFYEAVSASDNFGPSSQPKEEEQLGQLPHRRSTLLLAPDEDQRHVHRWTTDDPLHRPTVCRHRDECHSRSQCLLDSPVGSSVSAASTSSIQRHHRLDGVLPSNPLTPKQPFDAAETAAAAHATDDDDDGRSSPVA